MSENERTTLTPSSGDLPAPAKKRRGRKASDVRKLKARLRALLALGKSEIECMDDLDVPAHDLRWLRDQLMKDELAEVANDSASEVWAKYRLRQEGVITDLDRIIRGARGSTNGGVMNAAVGAAKAKAQLIDNILDRGQNLGVIHREPEKTISVNGVAITDLRDGELEELVMSKKKTLTELMERYAVSDYSTEHDGELYGEEPSIERATPVRRKKV